jgi:hypothetical protein
MQPDRSEFSEALKAPAMTWVVKYCHFGPYHIAIAAFPSLQWEGFYSP